MICQIYQICQSLYHVINSKYRHMLQQKAYGCNSTIVYDFLDSSCPSWACEKAHPHVSVTPHVIFICHFVELMRALQNLNRSSFCGGFTKLKCMDKQQNIKERPYIQHVSILICRDTGTFLETELVSHASLTTKILFCLRNYLQSCLN